MASCSTSQWSGDYTPQVKLTVTQQSSNDTQVVLAWTLEYVTHGYTANTNGNGRDYSVTIDGDSVRTGTFNIDGKTTTTIASGTKTVNKTTSSRNVSFSCSFNFDITWSDVYGGVKTASSSISIGAKTSYTVSFNANGGSGAPSSQTKWHGTTLTLSSTKPTRSGYTFVGWGTSASDISKDYDAGGSYTANAADTLYAIWKKTIKLTYNANNGSGAPSAQEQTIYNATTNYKFTISSTKPTRTGYTFLGWSTSSTATSSSYAAGGSITLSDSDTLYAVWKATSYDVTINCNGGSGVSSRTYTIETATFTLGTPTRTGYTFLGWAGSNGSTAQKTVSIAKGSTGNKSYTAQWEENKLTINYYSNYATSAFDGALNTVGADKNVKVLVSEIYYDDDYSRYGLANYSGSTGSVYMTRTGFTATGKWGTTTSGGTLIDETTGFATGQAVAEACGKSLKTGNATIDLYAQWESNAYTVSYNANGGTGDMGSQSVEFNEAFTLSTNTFSRDGYKFVGWNLCRDDDNTWYAVGQGWLTEAEIRAGGYNKKMYNDQLKITLDASWIRNNETTKRFTLYAVWEISGVVYIDNGTKLEAYIPYIDNGTSWDLYLAYVDNGTDWDIIS